MIPQGTQNPIRQGVLDEKTSAPQRCPSQESKSLISKIQFAEPIINEERTKSYNALKQSASTLYPIYGTLYVLLWLTL